MFKKLILSSIILLSCVSLAMAGEYCETKQGPKGDQGLQGEQGPKGEVGAQGQQGVKGDSGDSADIPSNRFGAKLDAPFLARINDDWFVGAEGGKDLNYSSASNGWFAYAKVTYVGTLLNKKKE
jgi:hypothetical protein